MDPARGYFMGRFTNGYDYTDYLSLALFGAPNTRVADRGTNFAYGGARASATSGVPDFSEQLTQYAGYLARGNVADRNGLYVVNSAATTSSTRLPTRYWRTSFIRNLGARLREWSAGAARSRCA